MPRSNPGQARAARRDAGLCLRCGRPARATHSYVPAFVDRLAEGGGSVYEYARFLGRPWAYGDPIPTYARLAHDPWGEECQRANYAAHERRRRAERRAWERQRRRAENNERRYRQLAEAGRCPRCGGARDRQGVTCSSCCRAARRRYLAARGGAAAVAGLEDDRNAGLEDDRKVT